MKTRRFLAAAVLAALTLYSGGLEAPPPQPTTDEASAQAIDGPDTAQWLRGAGISWKESWRFSGWFGTNTWVRVSITL